MERGSAAHVSASLHCLVRAGKMLKENPYWNPPHTLLKMEVSHLQVSMICSQICLLSFFPYFTLALSQASISSQIYMSSLFLYFTGSIAS